MPSEYHGNPSPACCCVGIDCACECANCIDGQTSCCFLVKLTGFVDNDCGECGGLDRTYYLSQDDVGGCVFSNDEICGECDFGLIVLEIREDGGSYKIKVSFEGHEWEKNFGPTKPSCCSFSGEFLDHITNPGGECLSDSATCEITSWNGECPPCLCRCENCENCLAPCCWEVAIDGMEDGTCGDCEVLNDTYYLDQTYDEQDEPLCVWVDYTICGDCEPDPKELSLEVYEDSGDYKIKVTLGAHVWEKNYGDTKPSCCTLSNESLTHITNSGDCDSSNATCTITSRGNELECPIRRCYIPEAACECDGPPQQLAVDLGVGGWTDNVCDKCDEISGVFVLVGGQDPHGPFCSWAYHEPAYCAYDHGPGVGIETFELSIESAFEGTQGNLLWNVNVILSGDLGNEITAEYETPFNTWDANENRDCYFLADEDGKITLDNEGEGGDPVCNGSLPATIQIYDALA